MATEFLQHATTKTKKVPMIVLDTLHYTANNNNFELILNSICENMLLKPANKKHTFIFKKAVLEKQNILESVQSKFRSFMLASGFSFAECYYSFFDCDTKLF